MPEQGRLKPCAECPWLRKSVRGYLGADTAEGFYRSSVTREGLMPCHMQIDYDNDPDWRETQWPTVDLCAGNMIYYNNNMKRPRRPELQCVDAYGSSPHVFQWPEEFISHHMPDRPDEEVKTACNRACWPFTDAELDGTQDY